MQQLRDPVHGAISEDCNCKGTSIMPGQTVQHRCTPLGATRPSRQAMQDRLEGLPATHQESPGNEHRRRRSTHNDGAGGPSKAAAKTGRPAGSCANIHNPQMPSACQDDGRTISTSAQSQMEQGRTEMLPNIDANTLPMNVAIRPHQRADCPSDEWHEQHT